MTSDPTPTLVSVNVGRRRTVRWRDRDVTTAIWKNPVDAPVELASEGAAGDVQADRRVHGGVDKAVYAYSVEDYRWWETTTGPMGPGTLGENLTVEGIDLRAACVGDRWRVGGVLLEVCQPREPCFKMGIRMGDDSFPGRFLGAERFGAYLRVLEAGPVQAGQPVEIAFAAAQRIPIASLMDLAALTAEEVDTVASDERVPAKIRRRAQRLAER